MSWLKNEKIVFSVFFVIMMALVSCLMHYVKDVQGSGRLVNYTGIVRGASQRMVKLDILGVDGASVETLVDSIIDELNTGKGDFELIKPDDHRYLQNLYNLTSFWPQIQDDMKAVRSGSYDKSKVLLDSEEFFMLADNLVGAAEQYSHRCELIIARTEICLFLVMAFGVFMIINQYYQMFRANKRNKVLERKAFVDKHTGLPNKNACIKYFAYLNNSQSYVCMMFDLNNLKTVNDTQGHVIGDQMIRTFAYLLRSSVPSNGFVGRYGGDEFVVAIENADYEAAAGVIAELEKRVLANNTSEQGVSIRYACGWASSVEFPGCLVDVVIGQADRRMYENKIAIKNKRGANVDGAFVSGMEQFASVQSDTSAQTTEDNTVKGNSSEANTASNGNENS